MKIITLSLILATTFATNAFAQNNERYARPPDNIYQAPPVQYFTDYAKIRSVKPDYQQINQPRQVCENEIVQEMVPQQPNRNYGGTALGAVAGGLLGNQIGSGNGRTVATVAGSLLGAGVGDNLSNRNQPGPQYQERTIQRCRQVVDNNRVFNGYLVEYEYRGQIRSVLTADKPIGNKLKINLQATPDFN